MKKKQKRKVKLLKKNKKKYIDDGHTIYNMDGLSKHPKVKSNDVNVTRKERFAMIRAAFRVYLPRLFLIILSFTLAFLLLYFLLK